VDPAAASSSPDDGRRRDLFRYLTADESTDYLAVMDLFAGTLLTDLSATEVTAQLADRGRVLERDVAEARCRQLVEWGNLVPSIRDARVSSVAEDVREVSPAGVRLAALKGSHDLLRDNHRQRVAEHVDRLLADLDQPRQVDLGWRRPDRIAEVDIDPDRQSRLAQSGCKSNAYAGVSIVFADRVTADLVQVEDQPVADVDRSHLANPLEYLVDVVPQAGRL
jgi:hypothetical protein